MLNALKIVNIWRVSKEPKHLKVKFMSAHSLFIYGNIAKGITDPRVEFISQVQTHFFIKFHLQNLDEASPSKSQINISLSLKLKLQNPSFILAPESRPRFNFITYEKHQQKKMTKL